MFYDILESKTVFLRYKKRSWNSRRIQLFPKELTHGLARKIAISPTFFFFGSIGQKKVFDDILEQKNDFLRHKNKVFKKSKNWDFSKGVNQWFW